MTVLIAAIALSLVALVLGDWTIDRAPAPASAPPKLRLINDNRVIPAQYADDIEFRRVAAMPGAVEVLES